MSHPQIVVIGADHRGPELGGVLAEDVPDVVIFASDVAGTMFALASLAGSPVTACRQAKTRCCRTVRNDGRDR
jgi:hypothetical protein